jgi:hypothetical protein
MPEGNTLFIILHYIDKVVYTCQKVLLYLSLYTTQTRLYIPVRRYYFIYHFTLHWQGCIYMSERTTLFITLHYTDKVVYTCQKVLLYLSLYTTLTRLYIHVRKYYFIYHFTLHWQGCTYMSEGTTLFITLHYTDKVVYTYQEVLLYLSLYTTLTRLYTCRDSSEKFMLYEIIKLGLSSGSM